MTTLSEPELREATQGNDAFSKRSLGLQLSLDSTSLGAYKFCPTFYLYSIVLGYQLRRKNVDLQFGILVHRGIELYHKARALEMSHEDALRSVICAAQVWTWDKEKGRAQVWPDPEKNRLSLLRLLVWYLDRWKDDPIQTLKWSDGTPAVEVNFHFPTGYYSEEEEAFYLCGYFDRLGRLNGKVYVPDVKTTRHQLDSKYFSNFTPDNQFTIYTLASRTVLPAAAEGVILDACQVGATFARFHREFIPRSAEALQEWLEDLGEWIKDMEEAAQKRYWRMNDRMCWNCDFKGVCSRAPSGRKAWLEANFERRVWDPTKERSDT
jgi:hypothetical protein